ncbi:CNH-domain-containing protein [Mucor ambiguus]|uniref:CNH-domain-containing protein n=1 Tax=Mucor ambiguus TaxID=91626 RepID=A0A0C9LV28_9FUNG|nr:CNH-domain-containing protein [Mucor ambiguus]
MALNTQSPFHTSPTTTDNNRVGMVTHGIHPVTENPNHQLTPAAAFRNKYYLAQQQQQLGEASSTPTTTETVQVEQDDEDFIYRPGAIIYAPLNTTLPGVESTPFALSDGDEEDEEDEDDDEDAEDEDDEDDNISIKTIESNHTTLFEPTSDLEPKIILQDQDKINDASNGAASSALVASGSTLLSKLSKSTAPMRAKLSTLSRSKTNLDHLWTSSSTTLSLPLRKSAESVHQMSLSRKKRRERKKNERSHSFSFQSPFSPGTTLATNSGIYPALLSKIAHVFKENMVAGTKTKDSIEYHDVFDGREAVSLLASIIKTSDRNLAVLVGRALEDQKLFHDVNYEHRLRDSVHKLYKFKDHQVVTKPSIKRKLSADSDTVAMETDITLSEDTSTPAVHKEDDMPNGVFTLLTDCYSSTCTVENTCYSVLCPRRFNQSQNSLYEENEDRLWINTVSKSLSNSLSTKEKRRQENIYELIYTEKDFVEDLLYVEKNWIKPLLTNDYIIPTDRRDDFVNQLFWNLPEIRENNALLLADLLQRQQEHKIVYKIGDIFLKHVSDLFEHFIDYGSHQIISKYKLETERSANTAFAEFVQTTERAPASRKLELNGYLTKPTTRLGRYNLLLREILKNTPENHPDCETIPKAMQLIQQFLQRVNEESGKTENRFGLEVLEKKLTFNKKHMHTHDIDDLDLLSQDRKIILKGPLKRKSTTSNAASESSELLLYVLDHCLLLIKSKFFDGTEVFKLYKKPIPLALLAVALPDQTRRSSSILPYNRSSTGSFYSAGSSSDFLPSPLLSYSSSISIANNNFNGKSGYPISFIHLGRHGSGTTTLYAPTLASRRKWVDTIEKYRQSIMEKLKVFQMTGISDQFFNTFNKVNCAAVYASYLIFGCDHGVYLKKPLSTTVTRAANHTSEDDDEDDDDTEGIVKVLSLEKVSQIDILEGARLLLILADKTLYTYSLDALFDENNDILVDTIIVSSPSVSSPSSYKMRNIREHSFGGSVSSNSTESRATNNSSNSSNSNNSTFVKKPKKTTQHMRKIGNNVSFFKVGQVYDKSTAVKPVERTLVCFVKYNAMTSTIRALEPCDEKGSDSKKKKKKKSSNKPSLGLFIRHSNEILRGFKDLYIPGEATSIQYFKNVVCVGSAKGFQMVDIGSAGVQSVLDPSDENHNFIGQRETLRPVSMFRHPDGCIMLCYNEIAFYIDKKGRRIRSDWIINWEGHPTAFAFRYPYIVAFDSSFIEIRHVNTGDLTQIITGHNIRCLRSEPTDIIYFVMEDKRTGNEMIFSLEK